MDRIIKKTELENVALLKNNETGDTQLTSDLPSRRRGRKSGRRRFLLPLIIIVLAGLVGFLIPTLNRPDNTPRNNTNASQSQLNNNQPSQAQQNVEPQPVYITKEYAVVIPNDVGYLNVRAEASTASARLGQLAIGDKLEIIEEGEGWYKVLLPEPLSGQTEGWISAEYAEKRTEQVLVE